MCELARRILLDTPKLRDIINSGRHTCRHNMNTLEVNTAESLGFRNGDRGTHTSRTIMLAELKGVIEALPANAARADYGRAIIESNILGKPTSSTRILTNKRLGELYALDPTVPLFRLIRHFWTIDEPGRPLLAILCALARDPLLRSTASPVLDTQAETDLSRQLLKDVLREAVGNRLNEDILDKVARNAASSWTQSGHLRGRARKIRQVVTATPVATAYALILGYLQGLRGHRPLQTLWTKVLDASPDRILGLAGEAKRLGLLDLKRAGDVIDLSFPSLLTEEDRRLAHGPN